MVTMHKVNLVDEDREKLHDLLKVGEHPARSPFFSVQQLAAT
jgi:hypothetical protein